MSDATPSPAPAAGPKKTGNLTSIAIGAVAVVAIITGIAKMKSGLSEFFGGGNAKIQKLLEESDAAGSKAIELSKAGDAQFKTLTDAVNAKSLDELRSEYAGVVADTRKQLAEIAEQCRLAAAKIDEALTLDLTPKGKEFLTHRSGMFKSFADAFDQKDKVIALILDDAVTDKNDLIAKMNELTVKADAALQLGNELAAKAESASKEK